MTRTRTATGEGSFVRAEASGMDAIELDLHLSKDGALVVMHDV
ncbi:glycerophosphodiester phosphodiesterase family protein, partial [Streptomyces anulatus]